jgi:hypothetical protein
MFWRRAEIHRRHEREIQCRIKEAERETLISFMAEQMKYMISHGTPKPEGIDAWMEEFFKNQPACGEVIYEAPAEWVRTHPNEALAWYSKYITPVSPGVERIVRGIT